MVNGILLTCDKLKGNGAIWILTRWLLFFKRYGEGSVPQIQVWNKTRDIVLAEDIEIADSFCGRLKGLLGRRSLPRGTGLLLRPCNSIHSFFVRFSFDVLFLDSNCKVVHQIERMRPFRISPVVKGVRMTLELPAGSIIRSGTKIGDQLFLGKGDDVD